MIKDNAFARSYYSFGTEIVIKRSRPCPVVRATARPVCPAFPEKILPRKSIGVEGMAPMRWRTRAGTAGNVRGTGKPDQARRVMG